MRRVTYWLTFIVTGWVCGTLWRLLVVHELATDKYLSLLLGLTGWLLTSGTAASVADYLHERRQRPRRRWGVWLIAEPGNDTR